MRGEFRKGPEVGPEENIPEDEREEHKEWQEQAYGAMEHWSDMHERWRKEEGQEDIRKLKKYGLVFAACLLGMSGLMYYKNNKIEKANRQSEEKINNAPQDYAELAASKSNLTAVQREDLRKILVQLQGMLPKGRIFSMQQRAREIEKFKSGIPEKPEIRGFEQIGVEKEDLASVLDERFFPAGFINGNITQIKYEEKSFGEGLSFVGAEAGYDSEIGNVISFYRPSIAIFNDKISEKNSASSLWPIAIHELAHESNWDNKVSLSYAERAQFLFEAQNTFFNFRKYSTPLIDIASPEQSAELAARKKQKNDKKEILEHRLNEWWAELCTGYLQFPSVFQSQASSEEKQLIRRWLLKDEPKFNNIKAHNERQQAWKSAKEKIYKKLVLKGMDADAGLRKSTMPNIRKH